MSAPSKMCVYIAGPMSGLPEFNVPAFDKAAAEWRERGYEALNPADNFRGEVGIAYERYIRAGLEQVLRAQAIALLPGWETSKGARVELHVAQMLGLLVLDAWTSLEIPTTVLVRQEGK